MSPSDAAARRLAAQKAGRHPAPLNEGRSRNMQAIRRSDTKPEIALRSALHRNGYRFRKDMPVLVNGVRIRPDIAFTRQKVAIFVDGCFWHGCPDHGRRPKVNDWYWGPKLDRTRERDSHNTEVLTSAGWVVRRIWEHVSVADAMQVVATALDESRNSVDGHDASGSGTASIS